MTYFGPRTEDDRIYAKWIRRLVLAQGVIDDVPLDEYELWRELLKQWTKLYHQFLIAYPPGSFRP
jgi:hypothetical protein